MTLRTDLTDVTLVSEEIPNDFTDETLANDDTKIVKENNETNVLFSFPVFS